MCAYLANACKQMHMGNGARGREKVVLIRDQSAHRQAFAGMYMRMQEYSPSDSCSKHPETKCQLMKWAKAISGPSLQP